MIGPAGIEVARRPRFEARWVAGAACLCMAARLLAAEHYTMDAAHCLPEFRFTHNGLTTQSGRFDRASGSIVLDPQAMSGSVTYQVDTASLNMGFGTETPDSPGFRLFDIAHFPTMTFRSTRLVFDARHTVIGAIGALTLLGVTRPLRVQVSQFRCALNPLNHKRMCAGQITARLRRSQFGMLQYIPAISDEVRISVPVEAYLD